MRWLLKERSILHKMKISEKASMCSGKDFWYTEGIRRLNIPPLLMTDGPHGVRKQKGKSDHVGLNKSEPATCFPTLATLGCSWDRSLIYKVGEALGQECVKAGVSVLLGPGINIKRSPLCGRNFEYISEDPLLSGELAASYIQGVQSKGVGTSLKHFVANNQEKFRMTIDALVDDRALREIYLLGMEIAVKKGQPWTVMGAYNRLNGEYCCENEWLINQILRKEWQFQGLVVTDWGACNNRVLGLKAGLDLEMPSSKGVNDAKIVKSIKKKQLDPLFLDQTVERLLSLVDKAVINRRFDSGFDYHSHHQLAIQAAVESMVLLKNDHQLLPFSVSKKVGVIGYFSEYPRYQGAGSSLVNPTQQVNLLKALQSKNLQFEYAQGYTADGETWDDLVDEAIQLAQNTEQVILMVGLPESYESEGFDRSHLKLPESHNYLIEAITKVNPKTVVVLSCGAPVEMPWANKVNSILHSYLSGQGSGQALIDIIFGFENPSGKLAESYPVHLEDNPSYPYFLKDDHLAIYGESIFVGYRYYDTSGKKVLFPFGHGLNYTHFLYENLKVSYEPKHENNHINLSFYLTNTGSRSGKEVIQVYVRPKSSKAFRPDKELKAFDKIFLKPKETKMVTLVLERRHFAYFHPIIQDWYVESGNYEICIGSSSQKIHLVKTVTLKGDDEKALPYDVRDKASSYYHLETCNGKIKIEDFHCIYNHEIKEYAPRGSRPFTIESSLEDMKSTVIGKLVIRILKKELIKTANTKNEQDPTYKMMWHFVYESPMRVLAMTGGNRINVELIESIIDFSNREWVKGLKKLAHSFFARKK